MNRNQARDLIKNTFTRPFDKTSFRTFTLNLLNRIDESKAQTWNTQYVKDAFKPHVQRYERLGTYTSPEREKLDVLIVHLTNGSKLEHARTAIRNFVADHLKARDEKEAALVAFVSPTEKQWRFSYVKMDYGTVQKESGKVGVETRLTPARRFSYLVGEGESSHTAQSRFVGLLQDTQTDPSFVQIEEAFSVEAVTKEFFTKYAELLGQIEKTLSKLVEKDKTIRDEFKAKQVNTVDFAKKLIGQIVFLYFLQKKGWLGVEKDHEWGTGPRDFLRRMANRQYGKYDNFFNDVLEPLFYDTLATDRGHEAWDKRFKCRIPFLNGGLFEPLGDYDWRKTDIILPNKLFTNNEFVEEGITGTGLLDVFDRYNFTVNEAEPLEKEVAIDPEMLGKVFENLIEENRRKGLGSYYTPREIVHYMCQESLINYLDTSVNSAAGGSTSGGKDKQLVPRADIETFVHLGEQASFFEEARTSGTKSYERQLPKTIEEHARLIDEKLAEITVCDPAVGSGAFPVGMMTEIVRARNALTPYFNDPRERTSYFFKRHAIQNCLYGVDIDPGAVEIAKLRLWLSLVVDEEDLKKINPLPNLDYKIVNGNSLLGLPYKSARMATIEELKQRIFDETDHTKKGKIKREIDELLAQVFASTKRTLGYEVDFDFQVFFSEVFHLKGGFDVIIGNPPYLESRHPNFSESSKNALQKAVRSRWGDDARHVTRGSDLLIYFFETGLFLVSSNGNVVLITQNSWLDTEYGKKFQVFLCKKTWVQLILDSDFKYFDSETGPNINTVISIFVGRQPKANQTITFVRTRRNIGDVGYSFLSTQAKHEQADVRSYEYSHPLITSTKWGFLLATPQEFLHLMDILASKATELSKLSRHKLSFGQGLNLTKDYFIDRQTIIQLHLPSSALFPILGSDDDAPFNISKTTYHLVNQLAIDKRDAKVLEQNGYKLFDPGSTGKREPILIMPRGLGRHYCAFNSMNAFSSSCVDVYDERGTTSEEMKLNLWLALNSSVCWLWRELSGRKNLGGGMLKAEAIDMKQFPIYLEFNRPREIKSIFESLKKRNAMETLTEIDSDEHRRIDRLVFEYLEIPQQEADYFVSLLKNTIARRSTKSKT
ncbi:MAG: BREX-1 system adenine-specific DNA-methyltransferase PglX [Ignavibacteriae bacterium]|nr:BREX-1 system adenine-specific DNA-methyltransferase PglX [Ignavibacteriota bacterium]